MKRICTSLALVTAFFSLNGQIKVATNNNVGIGESAPVSKFAVSGPGNSYATTYIENINATNSSRGLHVKNSITTSSWGFAILGETPFTSSSSSCNVGVRGQTYSSIALSSRRSYGVWGMAGNATSGWNYGVYGQLNGSHNGAAVFATVPGKGDCAVNGKYAGYFRGKVYVEDVLEYTTLSNVSDVNLKKDIRPLVNESEDVTSKLRSLSAIRYKIKTPIELNQIGPEVTDTLSVEKVSEQFKSGVYVNDQFGLSAQEVEKVFPELVSKSNDGYLRMNYMELIPVLVEAIKEQDAEIELLRKELDQIRQSLKQ